MKKGEKKDSSYNKGEDGQYYAPKHVKETGREKGIAYHIVLCISCKQAKTVFPGL